MISFYFSVQEISPKKIVDRITQRLNSEITHLDERASQILPLQRANEKMELSNENYCSFVIYDQQQVVSWSDNKFIPAPSSVAEPFQLKLIKGGNGDYLARKWVISNNRFLVAIIPLTRKYNITNSYLKAEWNDRIFSSGNVTVLEPSSNIGYPIFIQSSNPFRVSFLRDQQVTVEPAGILTFVFISIAILILIFTIFQYLEKFRYPELGVLLLYTILLVLRWSMIKTNFPNGLLGSELFNPQVFASSNFNASLGDLFLNEIAVLLVCIYIFRHYYRFRFLRKVYTHKVSAWIISIASGLCILFAVLFPFVVIQTLFNNSAIVLDITQSLFFNTTRIIAMLSIVLSGICSFLFAHVFIRILIGDKKNLRMSVSFALSILIFVAINEATEQHYFSSLMVGILYFLIVYYLQLFATLKRLSFSTFAYLFTAVLFLSVNGAYAIYHFSRAETTEDQFRFANNFLVDRDNFGEYLLNETAHRIANDAFIQTRFIGPFVNRDAIRHKIRQVILPSYFNRYDVDISIFDPSGEPLNNRIPATLSTLLNAYHGEKSQTEYEGVYFLNGVSDQVTKKYLVTIPIIRTNVMVGHIVFELSIKKIIPQSVYPELLVDNRVQRLYRMQNFNYAVYSGNTIVFSSGNFNYDLEFNNTWLGRLEMYSKGIDEGGYYHIAQEDQSQHVAVVSSPNPSLTYRLANFSFLLVLSLVFILILISILSVINHKNRNKLNYSARIQLFLNLAFFLPLILVSYTTLRLTNQSSQQQLNNEYIQKAKSLGDLIAEEWDNDLEEQQGSFLNLGNQISDLAKLNSLDVNVYDTMGLLLKASQPAILENNLLSNRIKPTAFQRIKSGESSLIEKEDVGSLSYFVAYASLKSPTTGKLWGVLGIPFFQSIASLEKIQINILANILNIFALIFIVLIVLSYFVSKWLTFPLQFITQSLRKTSLTKTNQPLVWHSDDEIGTMVKEYNQMLFKLSQSKSELEQTQRALAWREIAQQVAHEIKNPLTPMKLTLQQLERQLQAGTASTERTEKAVSSLLAQVETLNEIASSFSSFAKMPEPVMLPLDLSALAKRIVELHHHSGTIKLVIPNLDFVVIGDEQLLGRTFSNIILNAFESSIPGRSAHIVITLQKKGLGCLVSFADNGKGMSSDIADRIFLPHFTTKKSGSGLGLAIAKEAIEKMNGKIWFETSVGNGTIFFVELIGVA